MRKIIDDVLSFDFPLVKLNNKISFLELFHGPTMAFKDVGARFMSRCLAYLLKDTKENADVTVLVATSGDTGGAVASGFYKVKGIKVVILYPKGKVSNVQEKQLTTLGENITALEVDGTFDDCQSMVKKAFLDKGLSNKIRLTSANSINIGRWLPQMFYFFFSYRDLKLSIEDKVAYSVPSGNFGNICAGMLAKEMGCKRAITLINDPSFGDLTGSVGIDAFVDPRQTTVSSILQHMRRGSIRSLQSLAGAEAEVIEAVAVDSSPLVGKPLREIKLPVGIIIGSVIQGDDIIVPNGGTIIKSGDIVIVFTAADMFKKVEELFSVGLEYF